MNTQRGPLFALHDEVLSHIFSYVGPDGAFPVAMVCIRFSRIQRMRLPKSQKGILYKTPIRYIVNSVQLCGWAKYNGCQWNAYICGYAALKGNFKVLEWAKANECAWDWRTYAWAGKAGHLRLQQWALDRGCPTGGVHRFFEKPNNPIFSLLFRPEISLMLCFIPNPPPYLILQWSVL